MLTKKELKELRKQVVLNSVFVKDYSNNLFIKSDTACDFFTSYMEYLYELAIENKFNSSDSIEIINKYDNIENLWNWYLCYGSDPLPHDDFIAYNFISLYDAVTIYEVIYGINNYVLTGFYTQLNRNVKTSKITKNMIHYDKQGEPYIMKYRKRYYLKDFLNWSNHSFNI